MKVINSLLFISLTVYYNNYTHESIFSTVKQNREARRKTK